MHGMGGTEGWACQRLFIIMKILIVVPTYNEAANLPELVDRLFSLDVPELGLLVVDDNSPDGTAATAEALAARYLYSIHVLRRAAKEGIGPAYVAGFQEALRLGAGVIIQMDADLSHPPEYIPILLAGIISCDVAVGSRYVPGGGVAGQWGFLRRLLSRGGDLYIQRVVGLRIRDTKSGFKAFRREVLESIILENLRSKGFIFQAEVAYRCQEVGARIQEIPYLFHDRQVGRSKMGFGIVVEALWRSFQIRWTKTKNGKAKNM